MAAQKKSQSASPSRTIVFQGQLGAYSHLACRKYFPKMTPLPTPSFEDTLEAVREGHAKLAMIPIENSVAGRVPDIHQIMPDSGLYIIGERFLRVNHHLLAPKGATLRTIRRVHSHVMALGQCGKFLRKLLGNNRGSSRPHPKIWRWASARCNSTRKNHLQGGALRSGLGIAGAP